MCCGILPVSYPDMIKPVLTFCAFVLLSCALSAGDYPKHKARFSSYVSTKVKEPSDIVTDPETGNYFIVSDHGKLYECGPNGKKIRRAEFEGNDFEAIELKGNLLYVSDETTRRIYAFDKKTLAVVNSWLVPYNGGVNKGFETLVWNPVKKVFNLVTEADPVSIWELDTNFNVLQQQYQKANYTFKAASDISGGRFYKGELWLLSDEDQALFRCDPETYKVREKININVLNPEGLDFDAAGKAVITSDELQRIYFFNGITEIK